MTGVQGEHRLNSEPLLFWGGQEKEETAKTEKKQPIREKENLKREESCQRNEERFKELGVSSVSAAGDGTT